MAQVLVRLNIRDLTVDDLPAACSWAGPGPKEAPDRMRRGEVDYLAICAPSGLPVALGGIIYTEIPDAGTLWQLSVHPALRSCGIGTILINALEQRIRDHGLNRAELGVEESNTRARSLYERLGYIAYDRELESWDETAPDGSTSRYETMCTLMRKQLP